MNRLIQTVLALLVRKPKGGSPSQVQPFGGLINPQRPPPPPPPPGGGGTPPEAGGG